MNTVTSRVGALALATCLMLPAAKKARRRLHPVIGLKNKSPLVTSIAGDSRPQRSGGKVMTEIEQGPASSSGDAVLTAVDEKINREVLRQLHSIDCDDDDWRIEPLPSFDTATLETEGTDDITIEDWSR